MKRIFLSLLIASTLSSYAVSGELVSGLTILQISRQSGSATVSVHASTNVDGCYWFNIPEGDNFMLSMALSAHMSGKKVSVQLSDSECQISRFVLDSPA